MKFTVKSKKVENDRGWDTQEITIYQDGKAIGGYKRNYGGMQPFDTFEKDGQWYALYSGNYETLSLMELPSCKHLYDIQKGLCPTEVWVPPKTYWKDDKKDSSDEQAQKGAFYSGIPWGVTGEDSIIFLNIQNPLEIKCQVLPGERIREDVKLSDAVTFYSETHGDQPCFNVRTEREFDDET